MISGLALKELLLRYKVINDSDAFECHNLSGYPHISRIVTEQEAYFLKEMRINRTRREWIEKVYSSIESYDHCLHPLKNEQGCYTFVSTKGRANPGFMNGSKEYCYLLTREKGSKRKNPPAEWWARSLASLHDSIFQDYCGITLNEMKRKYDKSLLVLPDYPDVTHELDRMNGIIEQDVLNLIQSMMPDNSDEMLLEQKGSFVHGDPLNSNVLSDHSNYILFDFENSGISLKEYDIQRLFADVATNCTTLQDVDAFIGNFIDSYELAGRTINITLLDYLFRLDLIRTMVWLYETSVSYTRQDSERQSLELEKYKAALRSGSYHRVLSDILSRGAKT